MQHALMLLHQLSWWAVLGLVGAGVLAVVRKVLSLFNEDLSGSIYRSLKGAFGWDGPDPGPPGPERAREALEMMAGRIWKDLYEEWAYLSFGEEGPFSISFTREGGSARIPGHLIVMGPGGSGKSVLLRSLSMTIIKRRNEIIIQRHKVMQERGEVGEDFIIDEYERNNLAVEFDVHSADAASICDAWLNNATDSLVPVPVIFNLSAWREGAGIVNWMVDELAERKDFGIDPEVAGYLVRHGLILPMLDGYDEIPKRFKEQFLTQLSSMGGWPFVMAARLDRTTRSDIASVKVDPVVITLNRIPIDQAKERLSGVWGRLERVSPLVRDEVLKTPLMIEVARVVCELEESDLSVYGSSDKLKGYLLSRFVPALYGERDDLTDKDIAENIRPSFGAAKAISSFRYLAGHVAWKKRNSQGNEIAWWELGTLGLGTRRKSLVAGLAGGVVAALIHAVVAGAGIWVIGLPPGFAALLTLTYAVCIGSAFGLVHWMTDRRPEEFFGPAEVEIKLLGTGGQPLESPGHRSSQVTFGRFLVGVGIGSTGGFVGILSFAILGDLVSGLWPGMTGSFDPPHVGLAVIVAAGALFFSGIALVVGFALGLVVMLLRPLERKDGVGPVTLLNSSRRTAIRGGAIIGLVCGAAIGAIFGFLDTSGTPLVFAAIGATGGITIAVGGALSETAWGQWIIYGRIWLPLTGKLPWRTIAFLEDARRHGVLRQSGGYYEFRHNDLRQSLLAPDPPAAPSGS